MFKTIDDSTVLHFAVAVPTFKQRDETQSEIFTRLTNVLPSLIAVGRSESIQYTSQTP